MTENLPSVQARRFELAQIHDMAEAIARSGLFGMKTPEQAFALMLIADAEGLHPATAAQDYDIIQGRPARKSHSVLARFQAAGGTVEWHALNDTIADATFTHPKGGRVRIDWTIAMAANAKLAGKDNWKAYPRAMLRARCISEGVRTVYPAALGGHMLVEEAQDIDPMVIDNAPPEPAPPPRVGRKPKQVEAPPSPAFEMAPIETTTVGSEHRTFREVEQPKPAPTEQRSIDEAPQPKPQATDGKGPFVSEGACTWARNKAKSMGKDIDTILATECGGLVLDKMSPQDFEELKAVLRQMEQGA